MDPECQAAVIKVITNFMQFVRTLVHLRKKRQRQREWDMHDWQRRRINKINLRHRRRRFKIYTLIRSASVWMEMKLLQPKSILPPRTNIKSNDWWTSIMNGEEGDHWLVNMRMSKKTFDYICTMLKPRLQKQNTCMRAAIPVERKVALSLWKLATNAEYRSIAELFGVGITTVCKSVHEFCEAVNGILQPEFLRRPTETEFNEIIADFEAKFGVPQCCGAIAGSHIGIQPQKELRTEYYNKHGFYSIVLQGVCDAQYRFWDAFVGFAGSTHDSKVFTNSGLFTAISAGTLFPKASKKIKGIDVFPFLVGDPAIYPLSKTLMKPYANVGELTTEQLNFNYRISRAREVIDNAFERLKTRWQCLSKRLDCDVSAAPAIILTCCILHNICEANNDPLYYSPETSTSTNEHMYSREPGSRHEAEDIRHALGEYLMVN